MLVKQKLYPQGSGGIKLVIIDKNKVTVITRYDGDLIYTRAGDIPALAPKRFEGKRLIPANRSD